MCRIIPKLKLISVGSGVSKFHSFFNALSGYIMSIYHMIKLGMMLWTCVVFLLELNEGQVFIFVTSAFPFSNINIISPLSALTLYTLK